MASFFATGASFLAGFVAGLPWAAMVRMAARVRLVFNMGEITPEKRPIYNLFGPVLISFPFCFATAAQDDEEEDHREDENDGAEGSELLGFISQFVGFDEGIGWRGVGRVGQNEESVLQ